MLGQDAAARGGRCKDSCVWRPQWVLSPAMNGRTHATRRRPSNRRWHCLGPNARHRAINVPLGPCREHVPATAPRDVQHRGTVVRALPRADGEPTQIKEQEEEGRQIGDEAAAHRANNDVSIAAISRSSRATRATGSQRDRSGGPTWSAGSISKTARFPSCGSAGCSGELWP